MTGGYRRAMRTRHETSATLPNGIWRYYDAEGCQIAHPGTLPPPADADVAEYLNANPETIKYQRDGDGWTLLDL